MRLYLLLGIALLLAGCGSTVEHRAKTVTRQVIALPGLRVHTPAGDVTTEPIRIGVQTVTDENGEETKTYNLPDLGPVIGGIAEATTPWGAIISAVVGLGTAGFAAKKAADNARQRDEVIYGLERARDHLPAEQWEALTATLAKEQSVDTKQVVLAKTA